MARQTPLNCSGHTRPVTDLAFSAITPDGYFLISACKDGKPMLRNGQTGDWIGTFEGHKDGRQVITGSQEKLVRVFDIENGSNEAVLTLTGHTANIKTVLFADDGRIFSSGEDKVIRVWDQRSGQQTQQVEIGGSVSGLEICPDGTLLTVTSGKTVSFWTMDGFNKVKSFDMSCQVNSASLHPDKKRVVCGGEDFYLHVFDYDTTEEKEVYKGHHGPVHCVRYSPDGMLYASGSEDGTVRLWQDQVGTEYGLWYVGCRRYVGSEEKVEEGKE